MDGKIIEISTGQLESDKKRMVSELRGVEQELKLLQEEMHQLDAMWEGPAKQTFSVQFITDCETLEEICADLSGYIDSMQNAETTYKRCENQVAELIAAIRI